MAEKSPESSKSKKSSRISQRESESKEKASRQRFSKQKVDVQISQRESESKEKTSRQRFSRKGVQNSAQSVTKRSKLDGSLKERFKLSSGSKSARPSAIGTPDEESAKKQNSSRQGKKDDSSRQGKKDDSSRQGKKDDSSRQVKKEDSARQSKKEESDRPTNNAGIGEEFPDLIEKLEAKVVFPPGNPLDIRVNRGMTISRIPETMRECGLDLGDWITGMNGEPFKSRTSYTAKLRKLWDENKDKKTFEVTYQFQRVLRTQEIKDPIRCSSIHQAYEIDPCCTYLFGVLSLFPGSNLGLSIKSYYGKVYVSSVDNGFKSLAMRTFLVGDAILSVNGQAVSIISEASEKIVDGLKTKKFVKVVIERAVSQAAIGRVKQVLRTHKQPDIDPRMADDVVEICKQELARMKYDNPDDDLSSILRDEEQKKDATPSLTFSDISAESPIGMDIINPVLLSKPPPRADLEMTRKKRSRKSKKGAM